MKPERKKTVAFFIPSMAGGGAERVALNLIKEFHSKGWNVDLILNNATGPLLPLIPDSVRVISLNTSNTLKKLVQLCRYIQTENPSYLISLLDRINICGIAKKLCRSRTKIVVTIHSNTSEEFSSEKGFLTFLKPIFMRISYNLANAVVAVSQGSARDVSNLLGWQSGRVHVINNPVISPEQIEKYNEAVEHSWFNEEIPIFLSIGRLEDVKDFSNLIRAFSLVRSQKKSRLVILGEGSLRDSLTKLIHQLKLEEDIDLHGFEENPYKYIFRCSTFVMSSKYEGFGNVLVEALSLGKPIVSTNCPNGPAEVLKDGLYGKLVAVGDPHSLADEMLNSLTSEVDVNSLKSRASEFSTNLISDQYINLLLNLPE
jgi:glycosyltransferase involved in cell wall biosynthesis